MGDFDEHRHRRDNAGRFAEKPAGQVSAGAVSTLRNQAQYDAEVAAIQAALRDHLGAYAPMLDHTGEAVRVRHMIPGDALGRYEWTDAIFTGVTEFSDREGHYAVVSGRFVPIDDVLLVDMDGKPYRYTEAAGPWTMTDCCGAVARPTAAGVRCMSCQQAASDRGAAAPQ